MGTGRMKSVAREIVRDETDSIHCIGKEMETHRMGEIDARRVSGGDAAGNVT